MVEIAAIVLAAGRASRFASEEESASKVFALLDGRALVTHVVAAAAASQASPVVVVTGRSAELIPEALREFETVLAHNPRFAEGMASSIAVGLAAVPARAAAAIFLLADMPRVTSRTLDALIDAFTGENPDAVVPCHHGRRGNPVLVSRALFPAMMALRGDEGARRILADGKHKVASCEVDDPGILVDVDTRDALAALTDRPEDP